MDKVKWGPDEDSWFCIKILLPVSRLPSCIVQGYHAYFVFLWLLHIVCGLNKLGHSMAWMYSINSTRPTDLSLKTANYLLARNLLSIRRNSPHSPQFWINKQISQSLASVCCALRDTVLYTWGNWTRTNLFNHKHTFKFGSFRCFC